MFYQFGECSLDTGRLELRRADRRVETEPQVLAVLTYLIENRDRVVPRAELQEKVWGTRVVSDNALNVRIRAARRAIGDDGRTQSMIRTAQRAGYRFAAEVQVSGAVNLADSSRQSLPEDEPIPADPPLPAQPSVVVLPLQPIPGGEHEELMATGLTCDITTRIGRSRLLFVIARGTAFQFGRGPHDVREVGKRLGVRYVVQGSVQIIDRKMRLMIALADATTRQEIWSEQYNATIDDHMRVQEEVADLVVGSLQSAVDAAEERRSLQTPPARLDAWSAYHRGHSFLFRFRPEDCARAQYFFRRSIELEPSASRAYAGLSFVHYQQAFMNMSRDRAGEVQRAHDIALQSVAADAGDPMAHWALSRSNMLRGDLESARQELETSIALNPSYAVAHYSLGWVHMQLGERRQSSERIEYARRLSPYDPLKFAMLGVSALNLALSGNTTEAAARAALAILQPNAHYLALAFAAVCFAMDGQRDRARALYARICASAPRYDITEFLKTFPFRMQSDIRQIRDAFGVMQSRSS
jgi:TolB-like protein/Flp pilus assembly protein TadD